MKIEDRNITPFYIGQGRAMISLGPLTKTKYCTYSCKFCYVNAGFIKYSKLEIQEIYSWLQRERNSYNIIYISGDTDSFAPPRTEDALVLLQKLTELNVDILFTTRYVFSKSELQILKSILSKQNNNGKLLFACTSITQINTPFIEPKPIPIPNERIEQLKHFKEIGLVTVLAMRPFLPIIPFEDYQRLIDLTKLYIDFILGEVWYMDKDGVLEKILFGNKTPNFPFVEKEMDFDDNLKLWKVWEGKKITKKILNKCKKENIPFFMRSKPAIEWYRNKQNS